MMKKLSILLISFHLLNFNKAFSQDTLLLKISNLASYYKPCANEVGYEAILQGRIVDLTSSELGQSTYFIHVYCPSILNSLPKNSTSIYRVVLRKKFYKNPLFDTKTGTEYSLVDIR